MSKDVEYKTTLDHDCIQNDKYVIIYNFTIFVKVVGSIQSVSVLCSIYRFNFWVLPVMVNKHEKKMSSLSRNLTSVRSLVQCSISGLFTVF